MLSLRNILSMSSPLRIATLATLTALFVRPSIQQTYTSCNPTIQRNCPPNPALGGSISADFTSGPSDQFTADGNPTYGPDGVSFTVHSSGEAPQLMSNWYMMFGKYEITMKAAPGAGIVSSIVLQSDDLDEIDWEFLGAANDEVQMNYFGKGQTTTYDRMTKGQVSDTQGEFHTYGVEWTEQQIVWQIDGSTVRVLSYDDAKGQYPQTPCQLKFGSWSGGDSNNPQGTVEWALGPTDYSQGPFTMVVQSIAVVDYSTGTQYKYGDQSGDWDSIMSSGGRVNGNSGADYDSTPTTSGGAVPYYGSSSVSASAVVSNTNYPGLPAGWTVDPASGKVVPPSAAPSTSQPALSTQPPSVSPAASYSACDYKTKTYFDEQGFKTTEKVPVDASVKWDDKGFPVTVYPENCQASNVPRNIEPAAQLAQNTAIVSISTSHLPLPTDLISTKPKDEGNETNAAGVTARFSSLLIVFCTLLTALAVILT